MSSWRIRSPRLAQLVPPAPFFIRTQAHIRYSTRETPGPVYLLSGSFFLFFFLYKPARSHSILLVHFLNSCTGNMGWKSFRWLVTSVKEKKLQGEFTLALTPWLCCGFYLLQTPLMLLTVLNIFIFSFFPPYLHICKKKKKKPLDKRSNKIFFFLLPRFKNFVRSEVNHPHLLQSWHSGRRIPS